MAKGDVIIGIVANGGTFQPAAGVEVMLTSLSNSDANGAIRWTIWDATPAARGLIANPQAGSGTLTSEVRVKCGITNTLFIRADDAAGVYSGVQIK